MTDCTRFEDDLKAYADGELPWLRRRAVRCHLAHCASCQEEMNIMTQIAEDLRVSDTEDALPAALREKILVVTDNIGQTNPGTGSAGLLGENPSGVEDDATRKPFSVPQGLPPGRPALPVPGHRKRPALGWVIAGVALIAWFVFFSQYQHNMINARHKNRNISAASEHQISLQHLQSAEDSDSARSMAAPGAPSAIQTYDSYQPSAFKPLGGYSGQPKAAALPVPAAKNGLTSADVNGDSLRQVHKEASIGVQVPNPETTSDTVETMVTATGGYVASNNLSTGDDGLKSAELVVKVPVAQFETFLNQVAKLGNVQSKNITGEDITEKTSDADQEEGVLEDDVQQSESRLKALGAKAKWRDEEATRELRIQLAQSRARLVLLKRMAALGTLTVDLSQTPKAVTPAPVTGGFMSGLKGTTHDALQSLLGSAGALVTLVIWLLAYAPIWVPLLLIARYALKEYQKRAVV